MPRPKKKIENESTEAIDEIQEVKVEEQKTSNTKFIDVSFETKKPETIKNTISFKIDYSKDFTGKRFHEQGVVIEVSKETALLFIEKGIGKIIEK